MLLLKAIFNEINIFRMVMIALVSAIYVGALSCTESVILYIIFLFVWLMICSKEVFDIIDETRIRMNVMK